MNMLETGRSVPRYMFAKGGNRVKLGDGVTLGNEPEREPEMELEPERSQDI